MSSAPHHDLTRKILVRRLVLGLRISLFSTGKTDDAV